MTANPFNETLIILMLTMVIAMLFDKLIARAVWSAGIQRNPEKYARCIEYCNLLDTMRNLVISEKIRWRHG
jgi:hypothetical protein